MVAKVLTVIDGDHSWLYILFCIKYFLLDWRNFRHVFRISVCLVLQQVKQFLTTFTACFSHSPRSNRRLPLIRFKVYFLWKRIKNSILFITPFVDVFFSSTPGHKNHGKFTFLLPISQTSNYEKKRNECHLSKQQLQCSLLSFRYTRPG